MCVVLWLVWVPNAAIIRRRVFYSCCRGEKKKHGSLARVDTFLNLWRLVVTKYWCDSRGGGIRNNNNNTYTHTLFYTRAYVHRRFLLLTVLLWFALRNGHRKDAISPDSLSSSVRLSGRPYALLRITRAWVCRHTFRQRFIRFPSRTGEFLLDTGVVRYKNFRYVQLTYKIRLFLLHLLVPERSWTFFRVRN